MCRFITNNETTISRKFDFRFTIPIPPSSYNVATKAKHPECNARHKNQCTSNDNSSKRAYTYVADIQTCCSTVLALELGTVHAVKQTPGVWAAFKFDAFLAYTCENNGKSN